MGTSLISCCQTLPYAVWCFACDPAEVSQEFFYSAMELMDFLSQASCDECLEIFLPELLHLKNNWSVLDHRSKGYYIGKIVGKHGLTVFMAIGSLKAYKLYQNFRYTNTAMTLSLCYKSQLKRKTIVERSQALLIQFKRVTQAATTERIVIKNMNVAHHIMNKKHCWDRVVPLSGNVEIDFRKAKALLEELGIYQEKWIIDKPEFFPMDKPKIKRSVHEMKYRGNEIKAIFETNIETGESFLQNAFVKNLKVPNE